MTRVTALIFDEQEETGGCGEAERRYGKSRSSVDSRRRSSSSSSTLFVEIFCKGRVLLCCYPTCVVYHANYSILMAVVDAARLFSAGLRRIQTTIAARKHGIPPIKNAIGAPKSVVSPPRGGSLVECRLRAPADTHLLPA